MAKQVTAGDRFQFSARTYNDMNQLIESNRMSGMSMRGQALQTNHDVVLVKNISGINVSRFGVLGIAGILFDPQTALPAFISRTVFTGDVPAESHQQGRFLICAEPIAAGTIGRAWADGIVVTKVSVSDPTHPFADLKDGDTTQLKSAQAGVCSILWTESGTGTKWAVIRYGGNGGSGFRTAFIKDSGPYNSNSLQAYLDNYGTGEVVDVYFTLLAAQTIQEGHYTLGVGVPIPVTRIADKWTCLVPLQGTESCA